jgi:hypothetical protein
MIEQKGFSIEEIFPALNDGEESFLKVLVNETYEQLCDWASAHLNYSQFTGNNYRLNSIIGNTIDQIVSIEDANKDSLKELAMTKFLELPEYELLNDAYVNGDLDIKLFLGNEEGTDIQKIKSAFRNSLPKVNYAGLTDEEATTLGIANSLFQHKDEILKREFANLLISGEATNKFNFFQLFKEDLDSINTKLYDLYGLFSATMQTLFFTTPPSLYNARNSDAAIGMAKNSSDTEQDEGNQKRVITAKGIIFPVLTHEMAKGFMEYIMEGALPEDAEMRQYVLNHADGVDKEILGLLTGGTLIKRLRKRIDELHPRLNHALLPLILLDIVKSGKAGIQEILRQSEKGNDIIRSIIRDKKQAYDDYHSESF